MLIRGEKASDLADIRRVNDLAFAQPAEGALVDALRAAGAVTLSLVAEDEGTTIAGHILFSPVVIESDAGRFQAIGLGPMAVLPTKQRRGIGSALVREGLIRLRTMGHAVVVVLGHPEFYPRFGFRRAIEHVYGVDVVLEPATDRRLQKLSLQSREHRALLQRIAARALPVTREFGARDYGGVLLWYWTNFYQKHFWFDDHDDAIVIAVERPGWLEVCDVVATTQIDLRTTLTRVIEQPVSRIEFGFTPEIYWPDARVIREYTDSPLFVLGKHALPAIPFKYPILAQT